MYFGDITFLLLLPVLIFAGWAQMKVSSTFDHWDRVPSQKGYTGCEAARELLNAHGLQHLQIEEVAGKLSDHYDPTAHVLRLSSPVYHGNSVAALGVAAHEVGHALQHASEYAPMSLRSAIVPVAQIGSMASWPLFFLGFMMALPPLMDIGILLFLGAAFFQMVTLPVEINASRRAVASLIQHGIITEEERPAARSVLQAAALTYLAGLLMALAQLARLLILRNSRR